MRAWFRTVKKDSTDPGSTPHPPSLPAASESQFGLVAWLEQTRVVLPLKGVECRFDVCGHLVSVELDQVFHQANPKSLDCTYTFPLPGNAAVYRCEMHVNGRIIVGRVEEQAKARDLARQMKKAGRRTMLVHQERRNLFTLELGNVAPGDVVVVRLAYVQTVDRLEDLVSFHVPFCPGVRYIPGQPLLRPPSGQGTADDTDQVPDASRLTPPRMEALHPDAAYVSLSGVLRDPSGLRKELSSPTHCILVRDGDGALDVCLAEQGAVPDRDFVLRWKEEMVGRMCGDGWVYRDGADHYALVRLHSPPNLEGEGMAPRDIYFLVDRSGSMEGRKWEQAIRAFLGFLGTMGKEDRVWLTLFSDTHQDFAERPWPAELMKEEQNLERLVQLKAGGGTELLPALEHILPLIERHSAEREVALVIITDGQVGNERRIGERLKHHANLPVYTFGIDSSVNDAFLRDLARQQGGVCHLLTPDDNLVGAVTRFGRQLRSSNRVDWGLAPGWEPAGDLPRRLHRGQTLDVLLKGSADRIQVRLDLRAAHGEAAELTVDLQPVPTRALGLFWARERINQLALPGQVKERAALARKWNLLCDGMSFVAWDTHEKVPVATQELYQPAIMAHRKLHMARPSQDQAVDHMICDSEMPMYYMAPEPPEAHRVGREQYPLSILFGSKQSRWTASPEILQELRERYVLPHLERFAPLTPELYETLEKWVLGVDQPPTDVQAKTDYWQDMRFRQLAFLLTDLEACPVSDHRRRMEILSHWFVTNRDLLSDTCARALEVGLPFLNENA